MSQEQQTTSTKGDVLMKQAERKLSASKGFICTAFGQRNYTKDEAAELYSKAAAQYKIKKCYNLSGIAYQKSAEIYMTIDDPFSAKQCFKESAKCFAHNHDTTRAIEAYSNAIQIDLECDRIGEAARLQQEIAKMLFAQNQIKESINAYEKASEYYEMEHDTSKQNKMLAMIAQLLGIERHWKRAAQIFESIAKDCVDHQLLKWVAKDYLFKAGLLRMCDLCCNDKLQSGDKWNRMQIMNEEYCDLSRIYDGSREAKLISNIIDCLRQNDIDKFRHEWNSYDMICKMDNWKIEILHHIFGYMKERENEIPVCVWLGENEEEIGGNNNNANGNPFEPVLSEKELENAPPLDI